MNTQDTLRLERLTLTNFRCFKECTIDLHPELTVLVAENGQGKTAILDAIAIALGLFVDTLTEEHKSPGFTREDVHLALAKDGTQSPTLPVTFTAEGHVDGTKLSWSRSLAGYDQRARTTTKDAGTLRAAAQRIRERLKTYAGADAGAPPALPMVVFYGTGRLWSEHHLTERKRAVDVSAMGRMAGYADCLSPSSSFKAFLAWYETTTLAVRNARVSGQREEHRPELLLAAVEQATRTVLEPTGWCDLGWDQELGQIVVKHAVHGTLPLAFLSDGVRNVIALVADLAHRCVRLNPHLQLEAARLTPGVVLIDEVDMHLHPGWQQTVMALLRSAFSKMQFVVTTHSPQVLSSVYAASIRVLRVRDGVGVLETPRYQTRGVESADVMAVIMGIDPVPRVSEAQQLSEYRRYIEDGKAEDLAARDLRSVLIGHFGEQHPLMLDCDRLIRFQAFKLRRAASHEGSAAR